MGKNIKNFEEFKNQLVESPEIQQQFKENPVQAINQFTFTNPLGWDKWIYRIIVLTLGLSVLIILIGTFLLIFKGEIKDDKTVPTIFTAIGSAAIGALAGLLAPSPKGEEK